MGGTAEDPFPAGRCVIVPLASLAPSAAVRDRHLRAVDRPAQAALLEQSRPILQAGGQGSSPFHPPRCAESGPEFLLVSGCAMTQIADSLRSRRVIRIDSQSALCPPERLGIVMELLLSYRHLTV